MQVSARRRFLTSCVALSAMTLTTAATGQAPVLGQVEDSSVEFQKLENTYFVADRLAAFDAATGKGQI